MTEAPKRKSYPQFILALHAEAFRGYTVENGFVTNATREGFLNDHQSHLTIRQRQHLDHVPSRRLGDLLPQDLNGKGISYEGDRNYRQILPYTVLAWRGKETPHILSAYRRAVGAGESRLAGNVSIGYGGHVDLVDVEHHKSILNFGATIDKSLQRELSEEVHVFAANGDKIETSLLPNPEFVGLILDDSNDVGKLHVGYLQVIWLPEGTKVQAVAEDGLIDLETFTADDLLDSDYVVESWSRIAAAQIATL